MEHRPQQAGFDMLLKSILEGSDIETSHEHSLSGGVAAPGQSLGRHTKGTEDVSVSLLDTEQTRRFPHFHPLYVYIYVYTEYIYR